MKWFDIDQTLRRLQDRLHCNFIGTTAALIGAGIAAAGSVGAAAIGSHAAGKAAQTQSDTALEAARLQKQAADDSLAFQKEQFSVQQANMRPWLTAGTGAIGQLSDLLKPGGELTKGWTEQFTAPTEVTEQNDPGWQFRMQQGQQAIQRSAAAQGDLLSGGTLKSLLNYNQNAASAEYGNVYNRALTEYQQRYNIFNNNQSNLYNRLAGISGAGQTAASNLNSASQNTANNVSNILLGSSNNIANSMNNAAAARASGYVGSANAWGGAIGGVANNIGNLLTLSSLLKKPTDYSQYI